MKSHYCISPPTGSPNRILDFHTEEDYENRVWNHLKSKDLRHFVLAPIFMYYLYIIFFSSDDYIINFLGVLATCGLCFGWCTFIMALLGFFINSLLIFCCDFVCTHTGHAHIFSLSFVLGVFNLCGQHLGISLFSKLQAGIEGTTPKLENL